MSKNAVDQNREQQYKTPMIKRVFAMIMVVLIVGLFLAAFILQIVGHAYANQVTALLLVVVLGFIPLFYAVTVLPGHLGQMIVDMKQRAKMNESGEDKSE